MTSPNDPNSEVNGGDAQHAAPGTPGAETNESPEGSVKFTDKRRFDPVTGELRQPPPANEPVVDPLAAAEAVIEAEAQAVAAQAEANDVRVAELTMDLQRVTAEYANYRKRVDRDREAVGEMAVVAVLAELLPVLDDIELARRNDDLQGPFKSVAEAVEGVVTKLGLERFGQVGDPFDPVEHEALTHSEREASEGEQTDEPAGPICAQIYQPGYRFKDRVVRPARVAVEE